MPSDVGAAALASFAGSWLDGIGEIAVAAVTRNVDLTRVEAAIRGHKGRLDTLPEPPKSSLAAGSIHLSGSVGADVRLALPYLLDRKTTAARATSLWWSKGSALVGSSVVLCDGLPPAERFPAFIDGRWGPWGW
jgi:type VI secretion system protein ImpM